MTTLYHEPPKAAPKRCPCLGCLVYGPYCADTCDKFEAWVAAGRPGPTSVTTCAPESPACAEETPS